MGRWLYYTHALRLFLRCDFPQFHVRYLDTATGAWQQQTCVSAMASRVGNMGGLFRGIARGTSLDGPGMRLLLVHPPALLGLPLLFVSSWLRMARFDPWLTQCWTDRVAVEPGETPPHIQADGEWLGYCPAEIKLLPGTVRLLVPTDD